MSTNTTQVRLITVDDTTVQAITCARCGAGIYPMDALDAHMARHAKLDYEASGPAPWLAQNSRKPRHRGNPSGKKPLANHERKQPKGVNIPLGLRREYVPARAR